MQASKSTPVDPYVLIHLCKFYFLTYSIPSSTETPDLN